MAAAPVRVGAKLRLAGRDLDALLVELARRGYELVGPTLDDGQLIYGPLRGAADLPVGYTTEQEGGTFRLKKRDEAAFFGYGVGQHSFKQFLFPPRRTLWQARREPDGFTIHPTEEAPPKFAFIGVRACEIAAIEVQDRIFLKGRHIDPTYRRRREQAFILAVNCTGAGCGTGFCVSMGTGPRVASGFDLALTEVLEGGEHYLVAEIGSDQGADVLKEMPSQQVTETDAATVERLCAAAAAAMGRKLDTDGIKELLYRNYNHPRWDQVAARCLNCGNCTMVCPTCFCHTTEDSTDLTGESAGRSRRMDVCFTIDFSYLHGGSIRASARSRYRQWLTHKLATWIDQFGCSGCVGCGRCITWCPVAIDITEEVAAIRQTDGAVKE